MSHQKLPTQAEEREALREKGQFWTPSWVADAMAAYALAGGANEILDPAVGAGAFLLAAEREAGLASRPVERLGCELHPEVLHEARANGIPEEALSEVRIGDFVLDPPAGKYDAIVANPPYIRHHRLDRDTKDRLQSLATEQLGRNLDGRTGYHVFFLIRALSLLAPGGRLAFIMPADTCEGVFAGSLWRWISSTFRINGTVVFDPDATPFPGVDTNAVVFLIENSSPGDTLQWVRCTSPANPDLRDVLSRVPLAEEVKGVQIVRRRLGEAIQTGLSRPFNPQLADAPRLGHVARVVRGIATGANDFFFMTSAEMERTGIPERFFVRAVGRTRDVPDEILTPEHLERLDREGRATYLLTIGDRGPGELPTPVLDYIRQGEQSGLHHRALIRARRLWYRTEEREPPPFLFAYLGRRNARFIRNEAGVVPLTGFLCVYPKDPGTSVEALWRVLSASATHERLASVGKSYGGGAIKVEPRALERLPLRADVFRAEGLEADPEVMTLPLAA